MVDLLGDYVEGGQAPEGAAPTALDVRQLEVTYNRVSIAVQGVSISVPSGQIVSILGSNGAGKTTTLRAISGFLPSDRAAISDGTVKFEGSAITGRRPHQVARAGIALVPEEDKIFPNLTVDENLRALASPSSRASQAESYDMVMELFPRLGERGRQTAGYLSGGERQMLAIACALLLRPRLLLADEISHGIAPALAASTLEALQRLNRATGLSILLVEQNASAALAVSDYAYIMETGRVVIDGTPEKLSEHEDVREFYLGIGEDSEGKHYADVKQYRRKRRWWG